MYWNRQSYRKIGISKGRTSLRSIIFLEMPAIINQFQFQFQFPFSDRRTRRIENFTVIQLNRYNHQVNSKSNPISKSQSNSPFPRINDRRTVSSILRLRKKISKWGKGADAYLARTGHRIRLPLPSNVPIILKSPLDLEKSRGI